MGLNNLARFAKFFIFQFLGPWNPRGCLGGSQLGSWDSWALGALGMMGPAGVLLYLLIDLAKHFSCVDKEAVQTIMWIAETTPTIL